MSMYTSKDPAGSAALELGLLTVGLVNSFAGAHEAGKRRADAARARRKEYDYDCDLYNARVRADNLGREAIKIARELAAAKAEIHNLRVALAQRQGIIDRLSEKRRAA